MSSTPSGTRTCAVCGAEAGDAARFCPACGRQLDAPVRAPDVSSPAPVGDGEELDGQVASGPPRSSKKAITALVLAILGYLTIPILPSAVGLVLGVLARRDIAADPALRGRAAATIAIVLGAIGIAVGIAFVVLVENARGR
jgi:hypothetical protein